MLRSQSILHDPSPRTGAFAPVTGAGLSGWIGRLSIAQKLSAIVAAFCLVILALLIVVWFSLRATDAVRGYVGGEGLWSKGQKSAVYYLSRYAYTAAPADFARYRQAVEITLAYRQAREELEKADYDVAVITDGWVRGGIEAEEIPNLIVFFRRFREVSFMREAITIWQEGDALIESLIALGEDMRAESEAGPLDAGQTARYLARIEEINDRLTLMAAEFSATLGAGALWTHRILLWLIFVSAALLLTVGLWFALRIAEEIRGGIRRLHAGAEHFADGDLDYRIECLGHDELGHLAGGFNEMAGLRQRAECSLQEHAEELERANRELSVGNEELRRLYQAEAASEAKSRFLATISHEIRTPLHGILGLLEVFSPERLSPEQQRSLALMRESGHALQHLIDDVLDFAKIEAGRVDLEQRALDLPYLGESVWATLEPAAHDKGVSLSLDLAGDLPRYVIGDANRLRQVLLNLGANAVKFTPGGGRVVIALTVVARQGEALTLGFAVQDTGIGMSAEQRDRVFESFVQAETSTSRCYGGTGLGLAICKGLVERMGGEIGCESAKGRGSRFWFEVPAHLAAGPASEKRQRNRRADAPPPNRADFPPGAPARILVAEDNGINQAVIEHQLAEFNCRVSVVDNGEIALDHLHREAFDLLITDIHMPALGGHELTRRWREIEQARGISADDRLVIIGLTANAERDALQRCRESGMDDAIVKPLSLAQLDVHLRRWLRPRAGAAA